VHPEIGESDASGIGFILGWIRRVGKVRF